MYNAIKTIQATLGTITVSGRENLSRLLGIMELTEKIIEAMERVKADDGNGEGENHPDQMDVAC